MSSSAFCAKNGCQRICSWRQLAECKRSGGVVMSWMAKLYETYEQAIMRDLPENKELMPISHTPQNAHINIQIDMDGQFLGAKVLEKTQIILPATEKSAGRSSGEAPHPLADKLQYVAADYAEFGGKKEPYYEGYLTQLKRWCESPSVHLKVQAVQKYVEKKQVIQDLVKAKVCYLDTDNKLLTSWLDEVTEENPLPLLFKVLPKRKESLIKVMRWYAGALFKKVILCLILGKTNPYVSRG